MNDHTPHDDRAYMLADLLTQVMALQEDERRVIIHTLQENVGQTLTALALNLRVLERHNDQPQVMEMINNMREMATGVLNEINTLQNKLYPSALGSQGIVSAFEVYIQEYAHTSQIQVDLDAEVPPQRYPTDVEITLFRIVQDILEHLRDQQSASRIDLRLRFTNGYMYLVIESDGTAAPQSWRIDLMMERVRALGGQSAMMPLPLSGVRFEIALPLSSKASL
jgi:glucose-6-phosphate-specific signal transduction histidine kinase